MKIVADQIGAPTSAATIANALVTISHDNFSYPQALFAQHTGVLNLVCAGETSWHLFATAIVDELKSRGVDLAVGRILPITTAEFPTNAVRPGNFRMNASRLKDVRSYDADPGRSHFR